MKRRLQSVLRGLFGSYERGPWFSIIASAAFMLALAAVHYHHEAWRDEVHCWSVGRNSAGLWDLMFGDRRYDGHPFLPYYAIYLTSRLVHGVAGLHLLTIATATSAAYLWLRGSGAPRLLRLAFLPSYLFFYEYGVVGRCYIQGALLLFCFCFWYRRDHVRYLLLSALLVALALTSAYGAIMAGSLAMFLFTQGLKLFPKDASGRRRPLATRPGYFAGLALFLLGVALTAWTSMPPQDEHFAAVWSTNQLGIANVKNALVTFWWGFVPTSVDWRSILYLGGDIAKLKDSIYWLGAALAAGWVVSLRRVPMLAFGFLCAAIAMAFFQQAKYPGCLRHVGNIFLLCLACHWLMTRELGDARRAWLYWTLLAACLCVQIKSCWNASTADWERPFSGALEAAQYLSSRIDPSTLIIGSNDYITSPVAGYLDHSFLFAESGDYGQSVVSHNRRVDLTQAALLDLARQNLQGRDRLMLVLGFPLSEHNSNLSLTSLHVTAYSIVDDERFYIYEVRAATNN